MDVMREGLIQATNKSTRTVLDISCCISYYLLCQLQLRF